MMEILITKAQEEDLLDILTLQKECYSSEAILYKDFAIPPMIQSLEELLIEYKEGWVLKATINNELIGSVRGKITGDTCHIGKLVVKENMQNKGLGKTLMKAIEKEAVDCRRYELFTGNKSEKNLKLYEKLGYKRFHEKWINENLSMVFLEKMNP